MQPLFALVFLTLVLLVNTRSLVQKPKPLLEDTNPTTCLKCELVVEVFHFFNDAVIGGEGEEELRQEIIGFCDPIPEFKTFCDEVKTGKLWDTIFQALRDSLGSFYSLVGISFLECPPLKQVQDDCEVHSDRKALY